MAGQGNIEVRFPEHLHGGAYANNMVITHNKEEFILDFMMVAPPTGTVTSRVIVTPGHVKRMLAAMQENVAKYEKAFGKIEEGKAPKTKIGFHP